jgi:hypothetical protein
MPKSLLALSLAIGLSAGLTAAAYADDSSSQPFFVPEQTAQVPSTPAQQAALDAYNRNENPLATMHFASPYDQGDAFMTPQGTPLPGWEQMQSGK